MVVRSEFSMDVSWERCSWARSWWVWKTAADREPSAPSESSRKSRTERGNCSRRGCFGIPSGHRSQRQIPSRRPIGRLLNRGSGWRIPQSPSARRGPGGKNSPIQKYPRPPDRRPAMSPQCCNPTIATARWFLFRLRRRVQWWNCTHSPPASRWSQTSVHIIYKQNSMVRHVNHLVIATAQI
jgi:hypothetical protein